MKRKDSISKVFALNPLRFTLVLLFALSLIVADLAFAADKLVVKDSGGNTKFIVTDGGQVGIGTANPDPKTILHGNLGTSNAVFRLDSGSGVTNPGAGFFYMSSNFDCDRTSLSANAYYDGTSWNFVQPGKPSWLFQLRTSTPPESSVNQDDFVVMRAEPGSGYFEAKLRIKGNGNVGFSGIYDPTYPIHMGSGAHVTAGGVWTNASSREYKENIKDLTKEEAFLALNKLDAVTFNYKAAKEENHVGFIAEDVPDLLATKDRRGLSSMDIVAVLTKVVQEQQKTISELNEKVKRLEQQIK